MDAAARERGLEHVQRCASCAMLLVEERALSRDLRALSVEAAAEKIPTRVETALLTAFRDRAAAPAVAPAGTAGRRRWLLVAAALALLTFGLSLARWIAAPPADRGSATVRPANARSANDGIDPAPTVASAPSVVTGQERPRVVAVRRSARSIPDSTTERRQKRLPPANARRQFTSAGAPREFVTQFFPVMQGSELIPLESGQIVRVRMPRSNLIPLGIPLSRERANETIQADVLVSNDGLARAIRLVY